MRLHAICLTGALLAAAIPLSAGASTTARQAASAADTCPPGYLLGAEWLCSARQVQAGALRAPLVNSGK